jgi:hypothetical protein
MLSASEVSAITFMADRIKFSAQSRDDIEIELRVIGVAHGGSDERPPELAGGHDAS